MKKFLPLLACIFFLFCRRSLAQAIPIDQWKKAVVKIESIQQRYSPAQVDELLQQQLNALGKVISQHETFDRREALVSIIDTIRGTGLLIADGTKVYMVTAKHLIKATENQGNGLETVTNGLTLKLDAGAKKTNDIYLLHLFPNALDSSPVVFSDDEDDLAIVSFQKSSYKAIVAYIKGAGCMPVPIQTISGGSNYKEGDNITCIAFPSSPKKLNKSVVLNGKIASSDRSGHGYIANLLVNPGDCGAPVIKNNQLIGILSYQTGIRSNVEAAIDPYRNATSVSVIKSSNIFPLLRKLRQNEKNQSFNKD